MFLRVACQKFSWFQISISAYHTQQGILERYSSDAILHYINSRSCCNNKKFNYDNLIGSLTVVKLSVSNRRLLLFNYQSIYTKYLKTYNLSTQLESSAWELGETPRLSIRPICYANPAAQMWVQMRWTSNTRRSLIAINGELMGVFFFQILYIFRKFD